MKDKIKNKWLQNLRSINPNWKDGDLNNKNKTADLVNDELKLAIELKKDIVFKANDPAFLIKFNNTEKNFIMLSNKYRGYGRDANNKFSFYPNYKTVLLIECGIFKGLLRKIFTGVESKRGRTGKLFLKNKNLWESYPNIGCYLIRSDIENTVLEDYYFQNPVADKQKILGKKEVDDHLGINSNYLFNYE